MVRKIIIGMCLFITINSNAQDWIRMSSGGKLSDGQWVSSFQLDINRTESKGESTDDRFTPIGGGNSALYFQPGASINLGGDSAKTSSDDLLFQAKFLYLFDDWTNFSEIKTIGEFNTKKSQFFRMELNPSYNADKHINERLYYLQPKFNYNWIYEKYPEVNSLKKIKVINFSSYIANNWGARNSRDFSTVNLYGTVDLYGEFKWQLSKWKNGEERNLIDFKIQGNGQYIISEASQFSEINPLRFKFKSTLDFYASKSLSIGLEYKSGDMSPDYSRYESYGFTLKYKK